MSAAPLVVTLLLDPASQAAFDALRATHFPVERNHLAAHVTLFHALPGDEEATVRADLEAAAGRAPFPVAVSGVRSLGRGVAYDLAAAEADALRARLAARWQPWLTPQDARPSRLHVTVQNKVDPATARATLALLATRPAPGPVTAVGLGLHRYLGGPWAPVTAYPFDDHGTATTGGAGSVAGP